jgi:transposase-like protein
MTPPADPERYKNHRFPGEIISHGVWLYYRFPLSYRDVQELLFERGIDVTHEAIRQWCLKFGQAYANQLKHRRAQPGDKWHLDEVFLTIHGERHYLWRAVDQDDNVLDILVQSRRNKHAAKKFVKFRITHPKKLAAEHYVIMTLGVIGQDAPATLDAVSDPVGQTTLRAPVWRSRGIVIGPSV